MSIEALVSVFLENAIIDNVYRGKLFVSIYLRIFKTLSFLRKFYSYLFLTILKM